ncbi:hypothetical protein Vafri_14000 [Volvox africanus]|uniref:Uncharacterized protein n=1 Tax=Volvox africanus TaxID=51714 RepID=A0A8J4F3W3_9CHLO|nr:hypothetical protein Vafri_14000 [Volvox africanus]
MRCSTAARRGSESAQAPRWAVRSVKWRLSAGNSPLGSRQLAKQKLAATARYSSSSVENPGKAASTAPRSVGSGTGVLAVAAAAAAPAVAAVTVISPSVFAIVGFREDCGGGGFAGAGSPSSFCSCAILSQSTWIRRTGGWGWDRMEWSRAQVAEQDSDSGGRPHLSRRSQLLQDGRC